MLNAQSADTLRKEILDVALIRVVYKTEQRALKEGQPYIVPDTMALEIGDAWSKYYSYFRQIKDSVAVYNRLNDAYPLLGRTFGSNDEELQARLESKQEIHDKLDDRQYGEPSIIYKNRLKNEVMTLDDGPFMGNGYTLFRFSEEIPPQNWEIQTDTATVLNYLCQKAVTTFRGRAYAAWFTTDIPVGEGPWKLYGLPGMILKAEDSEGVFRFEAIGIEKVQNKPIEVVFDYQNFYNGRLIIFRRKVIDGNLKQWQTHRKERFKNISIAFVTSVAIRYYRTKNPIIYPEMEIIK